MDTLITNTTLITMNIPNILHNVSIGWKNGVINYIGENSKSDKSNYENILHGDDLLVLPGLVNAHFHSTSTLLKGMAQDVPEQEWMMKALAPISKYLTKEDRILGSKLAVIEGLLTGTTTFAEYSSSIAELWNNVYSKIGGRVVAAETINEISSDKTKQVPGELYNLDYNLGKKGFDKTKKLMDLAEKEELLTGILGPQALDMVTKERLIELQELSQQQNIKIHMHIAQGERERKQIDKRYNKSTIEVLSDLDYLNDRLIAAHCHNTTHQELKTMADAGVNMVSCQSSIGMIDGIVPPLYDYSSLGGKVGIGTDQVPGVGHANLFREMRTGAQFGKILKKDPTILPPWQMLNHATIEGAQVLGLKNVGVLDIGKKADIITIDKNRLTMIPLTSSILRNIIPNLVYSTTGYEVNDVFINGREVVKNGMIPSVGLNYLKMRANQRSKELISEAETDWREIDSRMVKYVNDELL